MDQPHDSNSTRHRRPQDGFGAFQTNHAIVAALLGKVLGNLLQSARGEAAENSDGDTAAGNAATKSPAQSDTPADTKTSPRPTKRKAGRVKALPKWNVVLLDDNDHTYDYVIDMLGSIFGHSVRNAHHMAHEVDTDGRVVVFTTHRELAELKCDQIRRYGLDPRISSCRGSMNAFIEPACG